MARRWTLAEEALRREELMALYVNQNKTIDEVAILLNISPKTVFDRLQRLEIPTCREKKVSIASKRSEIIIPSEKSPKLAELMGILLGDGHISHFQMCVTLGSKEIEYVDYVSSLIKIVFGRQPGIAVRKTGHRDIYLGSTMVTAWLFQQGLVKNKVASQVDVPHWVISNASFTNGFLRGFFDTDGSIYRLRWGLQISLTNKSVPLLYSLQRMLLTLGYSPSGVSAYRVYLTKRADVDRFFHEIQPANSKHWQRYKKFASVPK